jgi:hypothetical protein
VDLEVLEVVEVDLGAHEGGMTAHSQRGFFLSRKNTRTDTNVLIDYSNTLPLRVSIIGILDTNVIIDYSNTLPLRVSIIGILE